MEHFKKKLKIDRTLRPCFEIDFNELKTEKQISEGGFGMRRREAEDEETGVDSSGSGPRIGCGV